MSQRMFRRAPAVIIAVFTLAAVSASAQSGATRPRRVLPNSTLPEATPTPTPRAATATGTTTNRAAAANTPGTTAATTDADRLREARQLTISEPQNSDAWKTAGFAEFNLKQYAEAATDLQRALELQRAAGAEDASTVDALAQALVRTDKFEQALPLLVTATSRANAKPDAVLLYYRGLAEFRTGKPADAERSFNAAVQVDPKNAAALFYLGRINYERNQTDAAIAAFNRATLSDPRFTEAWTLLTYAYLRRAAAAGTGPKADADYLNAVRSSDALLRLRSDEPAAALSGQALIGAKQYARAATVLERAGAKADAQGSTLYLLGVAHSRAKNFPKATAALERAAAKTPDDVNIYRELGYAYEVSKQYAKALAAYQKGSELAPTEADLKESVERVRPFAK